MKSVLITSSILILVIAALRPLLRGRFKPQAQYALWLVAVVRLLVPLELAPSAFSALALLDKAEESTHMAQTIGQTTVPVPAMSYEDAYHQALREYDGTLNRYVVIDDWYTAPLTTEEQAMLEARARELQAEDPTLAELAAKCARPVWLGGGLVMGLWFLLVNLGLRRKLRRALPVEADCPLPVYVTPELPSPCLSGVLRPAVYVTPAALADPDRLRHVLTHELTHFRHGDHWWALVRCLCLCVYWFDPLVWWAAAMSRQDCELACDEGAIRRLGEAERIPYGRTLVDMIAAGRNPLLQTATTMTGGKRRVKERVELIVRRPRTVIALVLAAALVLGLTVGFTFTGAPEEAPPLSAETLRERLEDIPEELKNEVKTSYLSEEVKGGTLVCYYLPAMLEDSEDGQEEGSALWMLAVSRWSQAQFDAHGYPDSNDTTGRELFAQDSRYYYAIDRPFDALMELYGWEPYRDTFDAIQAFAMRTVLETEGVEPFAMQTVLATEGVEPFDADTLWSDPVQAAVDRLMGAASVDLELAIGSQDNPNHYTKHIYSSVPSQDFCAHYLQALTTDFSWEEFDWGTTEDPKFPVPLNTSSYLAITAPNYSAYIRVWEDSDLVAVHDIINGTNYYHAKYTYDSARQFSAFEYLRQFWFDSLELDCLRASALPIPGQGRSHEEIALLWAEGWEGALTRTAPGSSYACTYVEITDVRADLPDWLEGGDLAEFAEAHGLPAEGFGTDWFGFSYRTVFVPVDQTTASPFWVGNTWYYEGGDAPEGALVYSRIGILHRTGEGWVCEGAGTGW